MVHKEFIHFASLDSTNSYCLKHAETLASGTLVVANEQLAGRGRHGRIWCSPGDRNLYASFLLKPSNIKIDLAIVPHLTSLAIHNTLKDSGLREVWIKWPNDIYVKSKKIAGILAECTAISTNTQAMVIGFGVNVNMELSQLKAIDKPATSIFVETGLKTKRKPFLNQIVDHANSLYKLALSHGVEAIHTSWKESSQLMGREVTLIIDTDTSVRGKVIDFNPDYSLLLENSFGKRESFFCGDVSLDPCKNNVSI